MRYSLFASGLLTLILSLTAPAVAADEVVESVQTISKELGDMAQLAAESLNASEKVEASLEIRCNNPRLY